MKWGRGTGSAAFATLSRAVLGSGVRSSAPELLSDLGPVFSSYSPSSRLQDGDYIFEEECR